MSKKLPAPIMCGKERATTIEHIFEGTPFNPVLPDDRKLYRFVLPHWQRLPCWDVARQTKFVENVFLGFGAGKYVCNGGDYEFSGDELPMSGWLIDGQQRITALGEFKNNRLPIFGDIHFDDLSPYERRVRFNREPFPCFELDYQPDEHLLKQLYLQLAAGGVPHTAEDLARLGVIA
ncbi:hypothetical protein HNP46_000296 [Pseudomonas nitritireducens]|uniref:GmrSD restriction endonucleases N-terminal domain-containing protein n=1 Tax=Pseudomonas nitroreducens TaxID=46680 RepID=A0A7W7NZM9_PSENT|nr:DUF262 domain-containing protein [Pseudomonas nitritireducens]MBB4861485.1 hypothetical protein [Pseudomonas nitritireducens]